jgi:hypothetical protein
MKRFLVFAYDYYYPAGGMNDFVGSYDTMEEAQAIIGTPVLTGFDEIYPTDQPYVYKQYDVFDTETIK